MALLCLIQIKKALQTFCAACAGNSNLLNKQDPDTDIPIQDTHGNAKGNPLPSAFGRPIAVHTSFFRVLGNFSLICFATNCLQLNLSR